MNVGRALGVAVTTLVDALGATLVGGIFGWLVVPVVWVPDRVILAVVLAGAAGGLTLAVGAALAVREPRPFPVTRALVGAFRRLPASI